MPPSPDRSPPGLKTLESSRPGSTRVDRAPRACAGPWLFSGLVLWGAVLAFWLARGFLLPPADTFFANHEADTYVGRLVEFRDLLAAGQWSPQWCSDFRSGLGAPYFSYYQPGFFYLAALLPGSLPAVRGLGIAVALVALLGYASLLWLVGRRFGWFAGCVAGSALLLSNYVGSEVYIRGDFTELAAMMLVPAALAALDRVLTGDGVSAPCLLALSTAALIITHPAVALIGVPLLSLLAVLALAVAGRQPPAENPEYATSRSRRRKALAAIGALALGIGLAAFYWAPVFMEWRLVGNDQAFTGFYHYRHHFVPPTALVGPYDRSTIIPFTFGPVLLLLAGVNLVRMWLNHCRTTTEQRQAASLALPGLLLCVFLMSPASAWVWEHAPLLYRLQFPWRILSVGTTLLAVLAGATLPFSRPGWQAAWALAAILALSAYSPKYTRYEPEAYRAVPKTTAELRATHFAPDLRDEWLPRGATASIDASWAQGPRPTTGCRVDAFERGQGWLACRVRTDGPASVTLPHYYFPAGFQVTFASSTVTPRSDPQGLMQIDLPANAEGLLVARFTRTPARRWGLTLSAASLLILAAATAVAGRRRPTKLHCVLD